MKVKVTYMNGDERVTEEYSAMTNQHAGFQKDIPFYMIQEEDRVVQIAANSIVSIEQEKSRITV